MWFRVDDGWWSHPKVAALSLQARGLWVTAGSWCSQHLTDGHVPRGALPLLRGTGKLAAELVQSGLWVETAEGWQMHDWELYQPTRGLRSERTQVFEASGFKCAYCSASVTPNTGHVDHVVPIARGGSSERSNLVASCARCNLSKGAKLLSEWRPG